MQKKTANILCEAGANVIIGSGAKVIQPIEWISSSDGENRTLCAYSLGNMMCTMEYMESLLGGYLNFDIVKKADKLIIENVLFTPTVIHYDEKVSNISVRLLEDYSEESFNAHGSNIKNGKGKYSWYEETLKKYITKTYLPSWIT